jgi:hypothetical protein
MVPDVPPSPSRLPTSLKLRRDKTEGRQVSDGRSKKLGSLKAGKLEN